MDWIYMHSREILAGSSFLWLGSCAGIALEAKTKFKAKSLTRAVGLDVGRTVFEAFHHSQLGLAAALIPAAYSLWNGAAPATTAADRRALAALAASGGILAVQHGLLMPILTERANDVAKAERERTALADIASHELSSSFSAPPEEALLRSPNAGAGTGASAAAGVPASIKAVADTAKAHAHELYIALEGCKMAALLVAGILLLQKTNAHTTW
jgi:hypothetical protein